MKIRQYDVKRGAAKISALQSGKIDQYEYLTGEEIVQAKVTYCPLWKSLREDQCGKQRKEIEEHVKSKSKHEIYWTQMIKNQEIKILLS